MHASAWRGSTHHYRPDAVLACPPLAQPRASGGLSSHALSGRALSRSKWESPLAAPPSLPSPFGFRPSSSFRTALCRDWAPIRAPGTLRVPPGVRFSPFVLRFSRRLPGAMPRYTALQSQYAAFRRPPSCESGIAEDEVSLSPCHCFTVSPCHTITLSFARGLRESISPWFISFRFTGPASASAPRCRRPIAHLASDCVREAEAISYPASTTGTCTVTRRFASVRAEAPGSASKREGFARRRTKK
jgi:hypothetical protein